MTTDATSSLATPDQIATELTAVRLLEHPSVQAAIAETGQYLKGQIPHGQRTAARFDRDYRQTVFNALMGAVNADPDRPRVHSVGFFPHRIEGVDIPGTRVLHSNPDYVYRLVPVDGAARFVLHARRPAAGPLAFEVSLIGEGQATQGNLSLSDLTIAADGTFAITIDPAEANGRPNHLRSQPGARQLIIRDIFDNIAAQRPIALTIERLDPPARPVPSDADIIASAGPAIRKVVDGVLGIARVLQGPVNTLPQPGFSNQDETLVTQAYSICHFRLADDEGLLVRLELGTARYGVVPVTNFWGGVGDFLNHRTSVSTCRAETDPDGGYTFIVATRDPGIVNWVDTEGLDEGVICARWTAFSGKAGSRPKIDARVIRIADVEAELAPGTPRCDPSGRSRQLAAHVRDYAAW